MLRHHLLVGAALALAMVARAPSARADVPPTFADREGPGGGEEQERTVGVLLNPLASTMGLFGGDVDLVLSQHFALSLEGAFYERGGLPAVALGAGLLVYPGAAFEGLYLEPRIVYAHPMGDGLTHFDLHDEAFGAGATIGWQWTWDYGFTLRIGGGGVYFFGASPGARDAPSALALRGLSGVMDGSLGWTF
jgi:hypothetical protein